MAINPLTGLEEDLTPIGSGSSPVFENKQGETTTGFTPLNGQVKAEETVVVEDTGTATGLVADETIEAQTETAPLIGSDFITDIDEEAKGEVAELTLDRATFKNILGKKDADQTDEEKALIRTFKAGRALGETSAQIFGETTGDTIETDTSVMDTEAEANIKSIQEASAAALTGKQEEVDLRLAQAKTDIQDRGNQRMNVLDRGLSFSGFGRSSTAVQKRDQLQSSINSEIRQAQAKADLEVQLFKAQQEKADGDTISSIRKNLLEATSTLKETETQNAIDLAKSNQELGLKADEALDSFLNGTTGGIEAKDKGFDKDASLALGYISDKFGNALVDDTEGNPIAFTGDELGSDVKISNFKDGNDNTYVYKNGVLDSIIQNDGTILQGEDVKTTKVPAEVVSSKATKDRVDLEQKLRKEFNASDQVNTFTKIKSSFQRVQAGKNADSAAGDLALIFSFMKMLDPGSVVREGEFATAQNAAGIPDQVRNLYNKAQTGKRLNTEQREDFLGRSKDIFNKEKENAQSIRDQFVRIADDAGVKSDFITGAFDELTTTDNLFEFEADEEDEIKGTFGATTGSDDSTESTFKGSSGTEFNIPADAGLTNPDTTGGTNGIPETGFTEQVEISRTGTNVAKDTNNPGNITADSIPAGNTKEEYGKIIGATGTYLSPNGREYFIFPNVNAGSGALQRDLQAKISGNSRNIKPSDTLERFQRVYVGEVSPGYLSVLERITGKGKNTPIKDIDAGLLTQAVMEAEGFTN